MPLKDATVNKDFILAALNELSNAIDKCGGVEILEDEIGFDKTLLNEFEVSVQKLFRKR